MPVNIDDIKKLPTPEKLKLIDELWESIEDDWEQYDKEEEESPEVIALLEKRLKEVESGAVKMISWEEARTILLKKTIERRKGQHE
jgi:putative addiction module component (TIGR02574 family)